MQRPNEWNRWPAERWSSILGSVQFHISGYTNYDSIKVNNINLNILQWIESVDRSPLDIHRMSHELNFIFLYYYLFIFFIFFYFFF